MDCQHNLDPNECFECNDSMARLATEATANKMIDITERMHQSMWIGDKLQKLRGIGRELERIRPMLNGSHAPEALRPEASIEQVEP